MTKISVRYGEQDGQGHLIWSLLPLGPFDQMDHAIEEAFTRIGGGADLQPIRNHLGAGSDRREHVRARLLSYGRRLASDGGLRSHRPRPRPPAPSVGIEVALVHPNDISLAQGPSPAPARFRRSPRRAWPIKLRPGLPQRSRPSPFHALPRAPRRSWRTKRVSSENDRDQAIVACDALDGPEQVRIDRERQRSRARQARPRTSPDCGSGRADRTSVSESIQRLPQLSP